MPNKEIHFAPYTAKAKRPVPFITWLIGEVHRDDPVGDLARDVLRDRADGCLVWTSGSFAGLKRHLFEAHDFDRFASSDLRDVLYEALGDWKRECKNRKWTLDRQWTLGLR